MKAEIIAVATKDGLIPEAQLRLVADRLAASGVKVSNIIPVKNSFDMDKVAKNAFSNENMAVFIYSFASKADRAVKNIISTDLGLNIRGSKKLLSEIKGKFVNSGVSYTEDMAYYAVFPDGSKVFNNRNGIQHGFFCGAWKKAALALPAEEDQLKSMLDKEVVPFLRNLFSKSESISSQKTQQVSTTTTIGVCGINRNEVERRISDMFASTNPKIALIKRQEDTQIKISAVGSSESEVSAAVNSFIDVIRQRLGNYVYGINVPDIYYATAKKLSDKGIKVSFAEAYTKCELAANFKAKGFINIVAFEESSGSTRTKIEKLGVPEKLIKKHGAVSEEVAAAMAAGAKKAGKSDVGIAILGDSHMEHKPSSGIVYIAISSKQGKKIRKLNIPERFTKEQMRRIAVFEAAVQMRLFAEDPKIFINGIKSTGKKKGRGKIASRGKAVDHMGKSKEKKEKKSFGRKMKEYFFPMRGDSGSDIAKKLILMLSLLVFIGSSSYIVYYHGNASGTKEMYNNIKEFVIESNDDVDRKDLPKDYPKEYQAKFVNLWKENRDISGWIKIDNTIVDYPVVQRPGDKNIYYFRKDFSEKYNKYGVPFVDYETDLSKPSTNTIVYGHNMADGQMFGVLEQYKSLEFFKQNPRVQFNSVYQDGEYVVFGAFLAATREQDDPFNYHRFVNPKSDEEYNNFISEVKKRSFYNVPIDVNPNDELLTLSTCTYTFYKNGKSYKFPDGRLVVMARKVREGEDVTTAVLGSSWQDALMPKPYYEIDDSTPAVGEKKLEGLTLSSSELDMTVGDEKTLTYTTTPADATKVTLKWSSSDPNVATVDNGKVDALNNGTTTITLSTEDGRISASARVTVGTPVSTKLDELYFSKDVFNVQKGKSVNLTLRTRPSDFDIDNLKLFYMVEDENIATVNQNGEITGEKIGRTLVYVSTTDNKYSAEAVVNVMDDVVNVTDVNIDESNEQFHGSTLEVYEDQNFSLRANVYPSDATETDVVWSTSDRRVVAVEDSEDGDFEVKGRVGDRAEITVTTADGGHTDTIKVKIVEGELAPVKVTGVDITDSNFELAVGATRQLSVNVSPSNATNKKINWSTSNGSIATVSSNGVITGVAEGSATIKATANDGSGWTDTVTVTVKNVTTDIKATSVQISGSSTVEEEKSINLSATVKPDNATNKDVTWSSDNDLVARVSSNGTVTGVSTGAVNITATAKDGSGAHSTVTITVIAGTPADIPVTGITVSGASTVKVGENISLTVNVEPSDATDKSVTWSANNDNASVSGGQVTGVTAGEVTITATTANGKSASIPITVEEQEQEPEPKPKPKPEPEPQPEPEPEPEPKPEPEPDEPGDQINPDDSGKSDSSSSDEPNPETTEQQDDGEQPAV